MSKSARARACGRRVVAESGLVEVHRVEGEAPRGTVRGLAICGAVWLCPVCSAHIRQSRAEDLALGMARHQEQGGALAMATLTVRHHRGDRLRNLLDGLMEAWRHVVRGAPWQRMKAKYGLVGQVKAVEVTWGEANGWHPHLHVLLVLEDALTVEQTVELERWLIDRWLKMAAKVGLKNPSAEHGARLESVGKGGGLYVAKVQERSVALEINRGDLKHGRGGRWLPFELLAAAGTGESWAVALWHEYEEATHGRRCIEWSRGLRARWELGEEATDEEVCEEDATTVDSLLVELKREEWTVVCAAGLDFAVREAAQVTGGRERAVDAVRAVVERAVARAMARLRERDDDG